MCIFSLSFLIFSICTLFLFISFTSDLLMIFISFLICFTFYLFSLNYSAYFFSNFFLCFSSDYVVLFHNILKEKINTFVFSLSQLQKSDEFQTCNLKKNHSKIVVKLQKNNDKRHFWKNPEKKLDNIKEND